MTKERFIKEIGYIESIVREFDEISDGIGFLFGGDAMAENVFSKVVFRLVDLSVKYLSDLSGDEACWVDWFVYECQFGRTPMSAFINNVEKPCRTASDLWDIINSHNVTHDLQVK